LIFIEIFSVFLIFYLRITKQKDYTLMIKILVLVACERAIGLTLLVRVVRRFRADKIQKMKKCEGF